MNSYRTADNCRAITTLLQLSFAFAFAFAFAFVLLAALLRVVVLVLGWCVGVGFWEVHAGLEVGEEVGDPHLNE
jgi:hypothetical protein